MDIDAALTRIEAEYIKASSEFPKFNSPHEGYAILREEVDELWDEVKSKQRSVDRLSKEAAHVAAMAIRFLVDCC